MCGVGLLVLVGLSWLASARPGWFTWPTYARWRQPLDVALCGGLVCLSAWMAFTGARDGLGATALLAYALQPVDQPG